MKRRVLIEAVLWTALITLLHIQLNVGWGRLKGQIFGIFGEDREELIVGFLPVT